MKDRRRFGEYIGKIVLALGGLIVEEDIPMFLVGRHNLLDGKSPIAVVWQDGARGLRRVLQLIESMKTGSFA